MALPVKSVVAVSTRGVMTSEQAREIWCSGMDAALEKLQPECVLIYGSMIDDYDFRGFKIVNYAARKFPGVEMM